MGFKSFRGGVVLRVATLCILLTITIYALFETHLIITSVVLIILDVFAVAALIRYIEQSNYQVSRFLMSIKYDDFSKMLIPDKGKSFMALNNAFNLISTRFEQLNADKEAQYHYLQSIVEHVHTGLFTFDETGRIMLYNKAVQDILQIPYLQNINELGKKHPDLFGIIHEIKPGEKKLTALDMGFQQLQLTVSKVYFKIKGTRITLVSLQNIGSELSEKESDAWQKLIKVLTHEIMNSITPIVSISSSSIDLLESHENSNPDILQDIKTGLKTIENRGKGLMSFVDVYRSLSRVPKPKPQTILAMQLMENIETLMRKTFSESNINFEIMVNEPGLTLKIDPELIEQVLINLVLNAIDAVKDKDDASIRLVADVNEQDQPIILVSDNGIGIDPEIADKIFVPFFTTKKNGTGIGLSLSQQIMKLHSGSISVKTKSGQGTVFVLTF